MNLQRLKDKKWNYTAMAFGLTFLSFMILMIIKEMSPFGESSLLYSDAYHQYYPFFVSFRRALRNGSSLLYTWDIGFGLDYLGLISYYLASPLNLVSVLLPESWVLPYFSFLIPLKMSFASLFFAMFLKKTCGKEGWGLTLFSCFYGCCAWALAYGWNLMWLDTFALLPLVVMGMISLLQERKFALYTLSLFLSVAANYYIGLFTCIFILLSFFCYEICRWGGFKKFCLDLLLMAVFSALAICMTAFLELPTLAALQNTQSSVNSFPEGFKLNIADENTWKGLLDAMRQVAGNTNGGIEPSFKEGLPNLYCGVFANAFAFLFLFSRNIRTRDKICAVLLLLFFNVSFIIRQLDYIWHGFHFTNMIPYRFSFLYSFVVLYMAYKAYTQQDEFRLWQIIAAGILAVGLAACSDLRTDWMYLAYNGAFLLLYLFLLLYPHIFRQPKANEEEDNKEEIREFLEADSRRKYLCRNMLLLIIVLEMILNLVNYGVAFAGTSTAFYPRGKEYSASMIRYMHEREWDEVFFRAETTHTQSLNDGALNNYYGVSTFTSSANVKVTEFMERLGYAAKNTYNRYAYEESSPVNNLFFALKYMIERSGNVEENPYFNDLHSYGDVHLLENNYYLPLGFLAETELAELPLDAAENDYDFQSTMFSTATGIPDPLWYHMYGNVLTITGVDADVKNTTPGGYCTYTTKSASGRVNYHYSVTMDGFMCIDLDLSERNDITIFLNGTELYSENYSIPQMLAVCQVYVGDEVDIALSCGPNEIGTIQVGAAIMDEAAFQKGYEVLSASTLDVTDFSETKIYGNIQCDRDGLLYTSIPQDGNWHVYVDGEEVETVLIGEAMTGVYLDEGYHDISFRYRNKAFALGWKVSLAAAAVFVLLYSRYYGSKPKTKHAK